MLNFMRYIFIISEYCLNLAEFNNFLIHSVKEQNESSKIRRSISTQNFKKDANAEIRKHSKSELKDISSKDERRFPADPIEPTYM